MGWVFFMFMMNIKISVEGFVLSGDVRRRGDARTSLVLEKGQRAERSRERMES